MNENKDICRVTGTAGSDIAGAPRLSFDLLVVTSSGKVSGHVLITQALPLSSGDISVTVTGQVRGAGFGPITRLMSLTGTYMQPVPPPRLPVLTEHFDAQFALDSEWQGHGGFSYGGQHVDDVPVRSG